LTRENRRPACCRRGKGLVDSKRGRMEIFEKIVVQSPEILHLRSAAKLVLLVSRYKCEVTVQRGTRCVNAKSIIGLVTLGVEEGTQLIFAFQGDDAREACLDVQEFFQPGLFE